MLASEHSEQLAETCAWPCVTLEDLRRFAIARSLFRPTTLPRALDRLGFVQADPIRAPARAQDLILRQRVTRYRAGDLERRYAALDVEEDVFINYGFVTPRGAGADAPAPRRRPLLRRPRPPVAGAAGVRPRARRGAPARRRRPLRARPRHELLGRIVERDDAPPRSAALPRRAARRAARGRHPALRRRTSTAIRRRPAPSARRAIDALVDVVVALYAPLPRLSLQLRDRPPALRRAAVARRSQGGADAGEGAARAGAHRRRRLVLAGGRAPGARRASTIACACWRRSIRWCGTAADSNYSGAGRIASRPTRRWRSGSSATTRCRCCGAIASSAGPTCRCATACCSTSSASRTAGRRSSRFAAELDAELDRVRDFLGRTSMASTDEREVLICGGREVAITNPRKVLFPEAGDTKLDLARYYLAVADGALRGAGGRPNVLVRYPNGIGGEFFYQKRAPRIAARLDRGRRAAAFRRAAPPRRSCRATPRRWRGWPTSPASSCIRIRCAPTISIIPTSCASISIRCPASSGRRSARSRGVVRADARRPRPDRLAEDLRLARHPRLRPHRAALDLRPGAPRRAGAGARGRAARAGAGDQQVVEGGAPRRLPRLQPERQGSHRRRRLLGAAEAGRARLGAADLGRDRRAAIRATSRCATMPARFAARRRSARRRSTSTPCSLERAARAVGARRSARAWATRRGRRTIASRQASRRACAIARRKRGRRSAPTTIRAPPQPQASADRDRPGASQGRRAGRARALEGAASGGGVAPRSRPTCWSTRCAAASRPGRGSASTCSTCPRTLRPRAGAARSRTRIR